MRQDFVNLGASRKSCRRRRRWQKLISREMQKGQRSLIADSILRDGWRNGFRTTGRLRQ